MGPTGRGDVTGGDEDRNHFSFLKPKMRTGSSQSKGMCGQEFSEKLAAGHWCVGLAEVAGRTRGKPEHEGLAVPEQGSVGAGDGVSIPGPAVPHGHGSPLPAGPTAARR